MKKNEYVSPEMEIVEITETYSLLNGSTGDNVSGGEVAPPGDDEW